MFNKTRHQIFLTLFLIPTSVLIFLGLFVGVSFNLYLKSDFRSSLSSTIELSSSYYRAEKERLSLKMRDFLASPAVQAFIADPSSETQVSSEINNLFNSSTLILGCYLYTGEVAVKSNQLSDIPSLSDLRLLPEIAAYLERPTSAEPLATIRDRYIPPSYSFGVPYQAQLGVFSLLYREEEALLVLDLATEEIYSQIFDFADYRYMAGTKAFLVHEVGGKRVELLRDRRDLSLVPPADLRDYQKIDGSYCYRTELDGAVALLVRVPASNLDEEIKMSVILITGIGLSLAVICGAVSQFYAQRKTKALDRLNGRMKDQ